MNFDGTTTLSRSQVDVQSVTRRQALWRRCSTCPQLTLKFFQHVVNMSAVHLNNMARAHLKLCTVPYVARH